MHNNCNKPLLGRNPRPPAKKRVNTGLDGGLATAKSIFRRLTKNQNVENDTTKKGGLRRGADDGTTLRFPEGNSGPRIDIPGRGPKGRETIHFD